MIFSNIFLSILHNIGLYIYIVKYKSGIKILGFLQNMLKKIKKHFQKEKKYFAAYGQILKFFHAYFSYKKNCIFFMLKKSKNGYYNQFMIIH
jgi:hypothetical protein